MCKAGYTLEIKIWKLLVIANRKYIMSRGLRTLCNGPETPTECNSLRKVNRNEPLDVGHDMVSGVGLPRKRADKTRVTEAVSSLLPVLPLTALLNPNTTPTPLINSCFNCSTDHLQLNAVFLISLLRSAEIEIAKPQSMKRGQKQWKSVQNMHQHRWQKHLQPVSFPDLPCLLLVANSLQMEWLATLSSVGQNHLKRKNLFAWELRCWSFGDNVALRKVASSWQVSSSTICLFLHFHRQVVGCDRSAFLLLLLSPKMASHHWRLSRNTASNLIQARNIEFNTNKVRYLI